MWDAFYFYRRRQFERTMNGVRTIAHLRWSTVGKISVSSLSNKYSAKSLTQKDLGLGCPERSASHGPHFEVHATCGASPGCCTRNREHSENIIFRFFGFGALRRVYTRLFVFLIECRKWMLSRFYVSSVAVLCNCLCQCLSKIVRRRKQQHSFDRNPFSVSGDDWVFADHTVAAKVRKLRLLRLENSLTYREQISNVH